LKTSKRTQYDLLWTVFGHAVACCAIGIGNDSHQLMAQSLGASGESVREFAGDGSAGLMETAVSVVDIQGEYSGWMRVDGKVLVHGLQVMARADSTFEARLLRDGLPNLASGNKVPSVLKGKLEGQHLRLSSEGGLKFDLVVKPRLEFVQMDQAGSVIGQVSKVIRSSSTLGLAAPTDAIELFKGGKSLELDGVKLTESGNMSVGVTTKFPVGSFRLHLEFKTPLQADKSQQARGNSGVYIQRRYEVQILDSFGEPTMFNYCGSLYRQRAPEVNASLPPETWQTYDIWFTQAKWDEAGKKVANARITVWHNGIPVQDNVEIVSKTGAGQAESPKPLPILFQDHSDPVEYRNIWLQHANW